MPSPSEALPDNIDRHRFVFDASQLLSPSPQRPPPRTSSGQLLPRSCCGDA
jgi:hypothetical protein